MNNLAILGGKPLLKHPLTQYKSIGEEELKAANSVLESGNLSGFIGAWCDSFDGGPKVKEFESAWQDKFKTKYAISVNSNTSGLIAALGAIKTSPGDEIIVPPMTMSATVISPLFYGAIPVFVDLEDDYFCLDYKKVELAITSKTKAIIAVNLFGHPADLSKLRKLADSRGIYLIEDAAQSPLATENRVFSGTIGHIGVYSLNYHKHIHTGEGGMCCTNDEDLALRLRAIRNHGENICDPLQINDITNLIGFNFRMTEISAAIGLEQLKKLDYLVKEREIIATNLSHSLKGMNNLITPITRKECRHVYYIWGAKFYCEYENIKNSTIMKALSCEGLPIVKGYVKPLYLLPVFQKKVAIGNNGWPFNLSNQSYKKGTCPVAENLFENTLLTFNICCYALNQSEQKEVINIFDKVFTNLKYLADSKSNN